MRGSSKAAEVTPFVSFQPTPNRQQQQQQQQGRHQHRPPPLCPSAVTTTPSPAAGSPSLLKLRRHQAQSYLSFLTLSNSKPHAFPNRKQGASSSGRPPLGRGRCSSQTRRSRTSSRQPQQLIAAELPAALRPLPPDEAAAAAVGPPAARRPPSLTASEEAYRRVRCWFPRGCRPLAAAATAATAAAAAAAGGGSQEQQNAGIGGKLLQRHAGLAQAAAALGASASVTQGRRLEARERGTFKVTFAPHGLRGQLTARRACSSCFKTRQQQEQQQQQQQQPTAATPAAATAAAPPTTISSGSVGGPPPAAAGPLLHTSNLGGSLSDRTRRTGPPARVPAGAVQAASRTQQTQQPLLLQQQLREEEGPPLKAPISQPRQSIPVTLDNAVEPLAAEGASVAATRAAAVAKAAAAVAAAAQAEVEAAAAAWGGGGEYKAGSSGLSAEQRREQLMLVLRLLLLLPPELLHALQARLFMLQHQRLSPSEASLWTKRAATATNLDTTLAASGSLGAPANPPQQQAAGAPAQALGGAPSGLQKTSSNKSPRTHSAVVLSNLQQRHPTEPGAGDSTVNGLFLSATLQASAVLQLTPGRPAADAAAAAAAAAVAAGGSAAHLPSTGRLPSCRCRSAATGCRQPVHEMSARRRSPVQQQQQQQQRQQQQQQQQLTILPPVEDARGACLMGSQQLHAQTWQPAAEGGGAPNPGSLGGAPAPYCRLHLSGLSQEAEAFWIVEAAPGGPSGGAAAPLLSGFQCCGEAAAAAAAATTGGGLPCGCSSSSSGAPHGGGASGQLSCAFSHANAVGGFWPHRRPSQLLYCRSTTSQPSASKVGGPSLMGAPLVASAATDCCRGLVKGPAATHRAKHVLKDEQTVSVPRGPSSRGAADWQGCGCEEGPPGASAVELRAFRGPGAPQQGLSRQPFPLHAPQMVGLNFRPCSSGGGSSSSRRCWQPELLQLHLASLPSLLRAESASGFRNTAAEFMAWAAPHGRLRVTPTKRGGGAALAVAVRAGSSNTGSSSSSSSSSKEELKGPATTRASRCREGSSSQAKRRRQQQRGAANELAAASGLGAAAAAAAPAEEGAAGDRQQQQQPAGLAVGRDCPASPGGEAGGSLDEEEWSPAVTLQASPSPLLPAADASVLEEVKRVEEEMGWTAWGWGLRPTPTSEDLHASFLCGFPPLPAAGDRSSSSTSLTGPTSLFFCSNDPRGYKGPLVRSAAVISVEAVPAAAAPSASRGPPASPSSGGSACGESLHGGGTAGGPWCQEQKPPVLRLQVVSVGGSLASKTDPALCPQEQPQRQPSSCPDLQHAGPSSSSSSAERLLGGLVCSVAWRPGEAGWKKEGGLLSLGRLRPSSACSRSHGSLRHPPSQRGRQTTRPLFVKEPLHCSAPPSELRLAMQQMEQEEEKEEEAGSRAFCCGAAEAVCCCSPTDSTWLSEEQRGNARSCAGLRAALGGKGGEAADGAEESELPARTHALRPPSYVSSASDAAAAREGEGGGHAEAARLPLPEGFDWRSSATAAAFNACAAQLLGSDSARSLRSKGAKRERRSFQAVSAVASAAPQQKASAAARVAAAARRGEGEAGQQQSVTSGLGEGSQLPASSPLNLLFASSGFDVEHALAGGPSEVLQEAREAQQRLALQHDEELHALRAAASARLASDPGNLQQVVELYAQLLQRRCHLAMQRALKAERAAAALQQADEERVRLLLGIQAQLSQLNSGVAADFCVDRPAADSSSREQQLFAAASPATEKTEKAHSGRVGTPFPPATPLMKRRVPSTQEEWEREPMEPPTVPELLLLQGEERLNAHVKELQQLASSARAARASRQTTGPPEAPFCTPTAGGFPAGLAVGLPFNAELPGNPLEDFRANAQQVSAFLSDFSCWKFEVGGEFKEEESFLKQMQREFAAANRHGSPVSLSTFLLQRRAAVLGSLPSGLASRERLREILEPVAEQVAASLPPTGALLEQAGASAKCSEWTIENARTAELSSAPSALLQLSEQHSLQSVISWLEALRSSLSAREGRETAGLPESPLKHKQAGAGEAAEEEAAFRAWDSRMQEAESTVHAEGEALRLSCSSSLQEAKRLLEEVMRVRVVRCSPLADSQT
ncbi:hypothetical protein Efla_006782 [Eimeria flavescens]